MVRRRDRIFFFTGPAKPVTITIIARPRGGVYTRIRQVFYGVCGVPEAPKRLEITLGCVMIASMVGNPGLGRVRFGVRAANRVHTRKNTKKTLRCCERV